MSDAGAWEALVVEVEQHVSPEWARNARAHGAQPWIRLIALVDVHHQLTQPQILEKIGSTMADLAREREAEAAGWTALAEGARERRLALLRLVAETGESLLPDDLAALFTRSLTPVPE